MIPGARAALPKRAASGISIRNYCSSTSPCSALAHKRLNISMRWLTGCMHLPFEILSDAEFNLCEALRLPTFEVDGMRLIKRLTMIVRSGRIESRKSCAGPGITQFQADWIPSVRMNPAMTFPT
jgi:hypothetical protein